MEMMHTPVVGKIFPLDADVWACTSGEESTREGGDSHVLRGFLRGWGGGASINWLRRGVLGSR